MWRRLKPIPIIAVLAAVVAIVLGFSGVDSDAVIAVALAGVTFGAMSRDDT